MLDVDLVVTFVVISVLFLRQISILKQPNKINYAPLVLSIGAMGGMFHFILHPESNNFVLLLRESFIPLVSSFILYIIMNIMHQTQLSMNAKMQDDFTRVMVDEISDLKSFMMELEERMQNTQHLFSEAQNDVRKKFVEDIKTLDTILKNQSLFMQEFEKMKEWNKEVEKSFKYFSEVQLPELDNVVHKHIDILRIAEQDHYNKLKAIVQKSIESNYDFTQDIQLIQKNLQGMKQETDAIAKTIVTKTTTQLSSASKQFESELLLLKTHTEGLRTVLSEEENRLLNIKKYSETVFKEMVLSSEQMEDIEHKTKELVEKFESIKVVVFEVQRLKEEYDEAQQQLASLSKEMQSLKQDEFEKMQQKMEFLTQNLSQKIDESLEKLHDHYHITSEDISQSVQILAKKAQSLKEYGE